MNDDLEKSEKKLNNLQKTLIAFSPVIVLYLILGIVSVSTFTDPYGGLGVLMLSTAILLSTGMIIAGVFVVQGLKRRNPPPHPLLLVLAFLAVAVAYVAIGFGGCYLVGVALG